ncbi:sulfatase-like hydrolase/transferase [Enterococcus sp. BWB1-3]|uniref:sulfatase-like hydrolase/transferase n=1 Tax=Enterococcus sp. BWB1-3 TaxID=2787713 RepID=UPI0019247FB0|nr:sulfatase-like hydrolase/transferase [Enterococcus sp. BWB1-3]MBL1230770.1 sulfatase-like hydrolase/transferase [Enterococcus sp. BWB1-3]
MNILLTLSIAFILIYIFNLLFGKLLFDKKSGLKYFSQTLDLSFIVWCSSLLIYTNIFNRSLEAVNTTSHSFYFLINLFIAVVIALAVAYIQSDKVAVNISVKEKKNAALTIPAKILLGFYSIILLVSLLLYTSSSWLIRTFGPVSIDQLLYSMQTLGGTNTDQVITFIDKPLIISLVLTYFFIRMVIFFTNYSISLNHKKNRRKEKTLRFSWRKLLMPASIFFVFSGAILLSINNVGFAQVKLYLEKSTIFEKEYIDPKTVEIDFPQEKRNLIYIFVESLEGSFTSKALGGTQEYDLLEELTALTDTGAINFSNTEKIGGAYQVTGTEYTAAAIVAHTSGTPLKAPISDVNSFGANDTYSTDSTPFLPGVTSIAEILDAEGYNQSFVMGSDASFGGRRTYLTQHGDYYLLDHLEAKRLKLIPETYLSWWGYEDEKLFEYAKTEATKLSNQDKPFNLTLLTADTHNPSGLMSPNNPQKYDNHYANVISYSSYQIANFIEWCREQPFYENTTIVLVGDHLTMSQTFIEEYLTDHDRTVFNLFINSPIQPVESKNRIFTTMDMFPTTLASLNATIQGNKLGLGTNLFSDQKTLTEVYPFDIFKNQLAQQSDFYTKNILNYDETQYQKAKEKMASSSESSDSDETTDETTDETNPSSTAEKEEPTSNDTVAEAVTNSVIQ